MRRVTSVPCSGGESGDTTERITRSFCAVGLFRRCQVEVLAPGRNQSVLYLKDAADWECHGFSVEEDVVGPFVDHHVARSDLVMDLESPGGNVGKLGDERSD